MTDMIGSFLNGAKIDIRKHTVINMVAYVAKNRAQVYSGHSSKFTVGGGIPQDVPYTAIVYNLLLFPN
jgi:hypothetical protein